MFNPYELLKQQQDLRLTIKQLPDGLRGTYLQKEEIKIIVLNKKLNQVERRCTLTHELAHYFLGHYGDYFSINNYTAECWHNKQEYLANVWATDRLIETPKLLKIIQADHQYTLDDICDMFWVTQEFMFFKLQRLVNLGYLNNFFMPDITRYTDR